MRSWLYSSPHINLLGEDTKNRIMLSNSSKTLTAMSDALCYNQWLLDNFRRYLSGEILEIGCGIGNFTKLLEKFGRVSAIDINNDYLQEVRKLGSRIFAGYGDIEKGRYFFRSKRFDCVVCLNVLEHIKDDKKAISNMYKLLNQSGKLVLLIPAHQSLYGSLDRSIDHYRRYSKEDVSLLLKQAGFKIISIKRVNWLGAIGWWLANKTQDIYLKSENIKLFNLVAPAALFLEKFIEPPFGISILAIAKKL